MNNEAFKKHFNPYRNAKTLEWAVDNLEGFEDQILGHEMVSILDYLYDSLGDHITYNNGGQDKASQWADKNFDDLEFCLEHNPSWYWNNDKLGGWDTASPSWLQKDSGCDGDLFDGIVVGSVGNFGEIEIQAENGDLFYHSGLSNSYFRILARVAS